jgi:hypothetical protein
MIQDADLAGNFYAVQDRGRLWRRRPDKIAIVLDGNEFEDEFVSIRGYAYYPHGVAAGGPFKTYQPQRDVSIGLRSRIRWPSTGACRG